jgi:hypothetical protein
MPAISRPVRVRTEDGAHFNSAGKQLQTRTSWEYVRLESGEDLLVGPLGQSVVRTVTARLAAGDVDILQSSSAS